MDAGSDVESHSGHGRKIRALKAVFVGNMGWNWERISEYVLEYCRLTFGRGDVESCGFGGRRKRDVSNGCCVWYFVMYGLYPRRESTVQADMCSFLDDGDENGRVSLVGVELPNFRESWDGFVRRMCEGFRTGVSSDDWLFGICRSMLNVAEWDSLMIRLKDIYKESGYDRLSKRVARRKRESKGEDVGERESVRRVKMELLQARIDLAREEEYLRICELEAAEANLMLYMARLHEDGNIGDFLWFLEGYCGSL